MGGGEGGLIACGGGRKTRRSFYEKSEGGASTKPMPASQQRRAGTPSYPRVSAQYVQLVVLAAALGGGFAADVPMRRPSAAERGRLSALNDALRASNLSWVAGYNARFSGEDYGEVLVRARLLMGVRRDNGRAKPPETAVQTAAVQTAAAIVPDTWNSIAKFPHCPSLADIWDQGACASCFVLATVQSAADRLCIATHGTRTQRLSAQHMLSCCKSCGNGCAGGFPPYSWAWMASHGVVRWRPFCWILRAALPRA